jgi:hypothetical protein
MAGFDFPLVHKLGLGKDQMAGTEIEDLVGRYTWQA